MEQILEKLSTVSDDIHQRNVCWDNWTIEERLKLFELYLLISKKEHQIFQLIYSHQGTDRFEDIFRDYDWLIIDDKAEGVEDAINMTKERMEKNNINK